MQVSHLLGVFNSITKVHICVYGIPTITINAEYDKNGNLGDPFNKAK